MAGDLDKSRKLSIRDMIYIGAFIAMFAANWALLNSRIAAVEATANDNKSKLEKFNYELINYKLDLVMDKLGIEGK